MGYAAHAAPTCSAKQRDRAQRCGRFPPSRGCRAHDWQPHSSRVRGVQGMRFLCGRYLPGPCKHKRKTKKKIKPALIDRPWPYKAVKGHCLATLPHKAQLFLELGEGEAPVVVAAREEGPDGQAFQAARIMQSVTALALECPPSPPPSPAVSPTPFQRRLMPLPVPPALAA